MELSHIPTPADTMPVSTTALMPSMSATVAAKQAMERARAHAYGLRGLGDVIQPGLTPSSLLNAMPSITNSTPQIVGPTCTGINQWINDNPLLAAGILGALAFLVLGGKGEHHK
jgi:hypothetical protein